MPVKWNDPPITGFNVNNSISEKIRTRLQESGERFFACDNISKHIHSETERQQLIDELAIQFENVLQSLVIDTQNDPNSHETSKRLAKMYVNEIMAGRFDPPPKVTSFPNDVAETRYRGLLVSRCEFKSLCSHHHQPVKGLAFIGLLPSTKVIGLSKYSRIVDWIARRGTLQEEMTKQVADEIMKATGSEDVGVYVEATHGCMENRGVMAHSSLTQTSVLHGQFYNPSVKDEFYNAIKLQHSTLVHY
jgi:GTP cyclohydrolase IA